MQPTCLNQERQTANVIGISVGNPDRFQILYSKPKLQTM
jgi:hypothetical protein